MSKVPYNHKAIEKKWHDIWEKNPVNTKVDENGNKKGEVLLSGYVPVSFRQRSSCRTLERLCDL